MKVLIAPNAFKGCLTAAEAAEAMAEGVLSAVPESSVDVMPVSDGGDGLMECLLGALGGRKVFTTVHGPLGEKRWAAFGLLPGRTAVVEMAQASGLALLPPGKRDIWNSTSRGTGELIRTALDFGIRTLLVGMGGSATNDAGAGMALALGARLLTPRGGLLRPGADGLLDLAAVDVSGMDKRLRSVKIIAVSDVTNPLLGPNGSARVYGLQKGAKPKDIPRLERALARFASTVKGDLKRDIARVPGSGAAGGLGAGLLAFLNARIVPGGEFVLGHIGAAERIREADLVFTGEGRLDAQSLYGKAPVALARLARRAKRPVVAIAGAWDPKAGPALARAGIGLVIALADRVGEKRAMKEAARLLSECAGEAARGFSS